MDSVNNVSNFRLRAGSRLHRIRERLKNLLGYYNILLAVATPFATAVAGMLWVNEQLPRQIAFRVPEVVDGKYFITVCVISAFLLGLAMVSAYVIQNMHLARQREQAFNYDKHGTLYNGDIPNVAFRVSTVKVLFENLVGENGVNSDLVRSAGAAVGTDFAKGLGEIITAEVLRHGDWQALSFNEKMNHWAEYDSATGWGLMSARRTERDKVVVRVSHFRDLFSGAGGEGFTQFLSGYCEALVGYIANGHTEGALEDYTNAKTISTSRMGDDMIEFKLDLE